MHRCKILLMLYCSDDFGMNANTSRFCFYFALYPVFYVVVVCQTCNVKALLAYMRCLKRLWCVALEGSRQDLLWLCVPKKLLIFAKEEAYILQARFIYFPRGASPSADIL